MDIDGQNIVKEGDWVVLHSSDGRKVLGHVTDRSSARIGKRKRKLAALIGHRYGQNFLVRPTDELVPVSDSTHADIPAEADMAAEKNNRYLQDSTANQTLAHDAINRLKESGVQGEQLVQTVAKHSSTFKEKTAFSQDKYLTRKRAKFDLRVRLVRPTSTSLCDVYFSKSPEKTMHMRCDSLATLLAYSGVRSGARVLVYENCTGLVTGTVAERLGGIGTVLNIFVGCTPPGAEVLRMLNLSAKCMRTIVHTPIELLDDIHTEEASDNEPLKYTSKADMANGTGNFQGHQPNPSRAEAIALRPKRGTVKNWLKVGCDCLIVATRYDVVKVFDILLKYVAPSGCFAAYCVHLQDAADLQYALQLSKMAIRVELWESTLVHHQVLPGRTHPEMTDSATGGYVVSGVRIEMARNIPTTNRPIKQNADIMS